MSGRKRNLLQKDKQDVPQTKRIRGGKSPTKSEKKMDFLTFRQIYSRREEACKKRLLQLMQKQDGENVGIFANYTERTLKVLLNLNKILEIEEVLLDTMKSFELPSEMILYQERQIAAYTSQIKKCEEIVQYRLNNTTNLGSM